MIASDTLFDSRGGFSGSSYSMKRVVLKTPTTQTNADNDN